jgi:hypothetical protein
MLPFCLLSQSLHVFLMLFEPKSERRLAILLGLPERCHSGIKPLARFADCGVMPGLRPRNKRAEESNGGGR